MYQITVVTNGFIVCYPHASVESLLRQVSALVAAGKEFSVGPAAMRGAA